MCGADTDNGKLCPGQFREGLGVDTGGGGQLADAARTIAREVRDGSLDPDAVTEETITSRLYTAALPDPDLLIRTSGEMRVSNFLLWQISYAEIVVTPKLWPQFGRDDLFAAIREYAGRHRRYGGI